MSTTHHPVDSTTRPCCQCVSQHVPDCAAEDRITNPILSIADLTDLGPAPEPPAWCLPGTEPNTESTGDGHLWSWHRDFGDNVRVECSDAVVNGRIMRTPARIVYNEERLGLDVALARQLAAELDQAADVLAAAELTEAALR